MGIEKSITILIVIVIAVVIAVTLTGWISSVWTIYSARTEVLKLLPDTYINCKENPPHLYLHIYTNIKPSLEIIKVEVSGGITATYNNYVLESGPRPRVTGNKIVLEPGAWIWLIYDLDSCPTGMYYGTVNVYIYTSLGNVYSIPATIK